MRFCQWKNYLILLSVLFSLFFTASPGFSAVDRVICVPWQGDPLKFHTAISDESVRLKGVIKTTDTTTIWYKWVYGDGSESAVISEQGSLFYHVQADNIYSGAVGTPFTAKLVVANDSGFVSTVVEDPYPVKIFENNQDARINIAIDNGLWWLFNNNYVYSALYTFDGSPFMVWRQWSYENCYASPTASAIQAFAINNHKIYGDPDEDPYVEAVQKGMNWLMQGYYYNSSYPMLRSVAISTQTQGNPDLNPIPNGVGVEVRDRDYRPIYQGGQVIDAIIASGVQPDDDTGRNFTGRTEEDGGNWTYGELLQDLCDMYAYGQVDSGSSRGGWMYSWNSGSDNSAAQWAAVGMIPAQESPWNCVVPDWVKTENEIWLDYSYSSGHFGYRWASYEHDWYHNTTPSGMVQMSMDGQIGYDDPATADIDERDEKWAASEKYIADNWYRFLHSNSRNWGEMMSYGWYAFAKAMRLAVPKPVERITKSDGTDFDWYNGSGDDKGLAQRILETQDITGYWDGNLTNAPLTTAWMIIVLKPALFSASPVACFTAEPNPTYSEEPVSFDPACSEHSETGKDISNIVSFEWDFDNDGVYDVSTEAPDRVSHTFTCNDVPCEYPVTLKVTDDEGLTSTYTLSINITDPPHPPVADAGGPYLVSLSDLDSLVLDGSGSYEMDAGSSETGCTDCEEDHLIAWEWDLTPPLTDFTNGSGEVITLDGLTLASLLTPGTHTLGLKVTDNTALAFPSSGQPNLTDVDFATIEVYNAGIRDLAARAKETKCQLTWGHIGATAYKILRSTDGPNSGFVQIGTTTSTYSTFLDYNLTGDVVVENTCKGDFDGNEVVDEDDAAIFTQAIGTQELDAGYNPAADFDDDGDVDGKDVVFFAAEFGRIGCMQETGIELNKDYWYRIETQMNGASILSNPAFVNSRGLISNLPPVFISDAVTEAEDNVLYQYDVQASDPEGEAVVFTFQSAPAGMTIDAGTGLITWTPSSDQIGPNDVLVKAADINGYASTQFFIVTVDPGPNTAPSVDAGGPYTGLVSQEISFDGTGSTDPDGDTLVAYHWIFGDGTDAYGSQVTHAYSGAGIYTITLHVEDSQGRTGHGTTTCEIGNPNRPPIAFINAPATADAGTLITFSGSSSYDPDNDPLTYGWDFGGGNTASGVEASFTYNEPGEYPVSLTIDDGRGGIDTLVHTITLGPPNTPPVFGTPAVSVTGDQYNTIPLTFTANATDSDFDYLDFSWEFGDGDTGNGQVVSHAYAAPGNYTARVTINDGRGGIVTETISLVIAQIPNRPPVAEANGPDPQQGDLASGSPVNISFTSAGSYDPDNDDLIYEWAYGGSVYTGAAVSIPFDTVGWHDVILTVTENTADALSSTDTARVLIIDSNDTAAPTAVITTPGSSTSTITDKIDVMGTADDAEHFAGFVLEISGEKDASGDWINWTTLNEETSPVVEGVLGTIDPSSLKNDFYRLRLRVSDGTQETSYWIEIKVAGELKFGNLKMSFNDLNIPVAGLPITITRTYDSFNKSTGDFGHGWTLDINSAQVKEDVNHNVFITLPDGRRVAFGFTPIRLSPFFPGWDVRFMAPPGVHAELDFVGDHMVNQSADGDWYWFSGLFNPDDYILKTKDGRTYEINQQDGIKKVTDRNNNQLTISDSGIIHSSGKSIVFERDAEGRIQRITDPGGNQIQYAYDANGDLVTVTYPEGYVMAFEYNDNHFITKVTDPEGRAVQQNEYDENGRLVATTDDEGARTTFIHDVDNKTETAIDARGNTSLAEFNDQGLKTEEIDQLGNRKVWIYDAGQNIIGHEIWDADDNLLRSMGMEYDADGNPIKIILPDGGEYVNTFNDGNRMTSMTLPDGKRQIFEYDADFNLVRVTDSLGHETEYTYDGSGNRTSVTDARGKTTHYSFDDFGNLVSVIDPCGEHHQYSRDDWGNILTYTRPDGAVYTHVYDSMGRKTEIIDPLGNSRRFEYDGRGNKTAEVDKNGYRTTFEYNSKDKVTRTVYPDGSETIFTYDVLGNMTAMTDALGNQWTYAYDAANRKINQTDPLGNQTQFEYDADGDISAVIDANGNRTSYERDANGRVIQITDVMGHVTAYEYDVAGNMTRLTDANGNVRQFVYGDWYRLIEEIQPDGSSIAYEYDGTGNRIKRTDAASHQTLYVYDDCNRLVSRQYPDGSSVDFAYDMLGNRVSMDDAAGHTDYTYDILNRMTQVVKPAGSIVYAYDSAGNITSITDPLGTTEKSYNSRNALVSVRDRSLRITQYGFNPIGNLASVTYPNGIGTSYLRDTSNRITAIDYSDAGGSLGVSTSYTYDPVGNVLSKAFVSGQSSAFEYDSLYRLVRETRGTGEVTDYSYDAVGNRLSKTDSGSSTVSHTYNILDQFVSRTYDLNGNMISDGVFDYFYDYENRLVSIKNGGSEVAAYIYDGDGNRVRVTVFGSGTRTFLVDTNMRYPSVLVETDLSTGAAIGYTYGHSLISMEKATGDISFFMHDAIGSTVGLSNGAGSVTDTYQYDPFGAVRSHTGTTDNDVLFAGSRFDSESGLYHMRARQYDPAMGRFLSRDPAKGKTSSPMSFHPYMYANASPLVYTDPMGTQAILSYTGTIVNNPAQWLGAFVGGFGAGYTVNNLGFISEVLKNAGKPLGQVIGNGLLGMLKQLTLLDCGQLAITMAIEDALSGALLALGHELLYDTGGNAANGTWGPTHEQVKMAMTNFAVNIGKMLVTKAFDAVEEIPMGSAFSGTFKAFDIGKVLGSALSLYNIARSFM